MRSTARRARSAPALAAAAALAGVLLMGAGCSSTPPLPQMPAGTLDKLHAGLTTRADAQALLGAPGETEPMPDGSEAWIYTYAPPPLPTSPDPPPTSDHIPRYDVLRLVFRPDGVLATHDVTRLVAQPRRGGVPALKALGTP